MRRLLSPEPKRRPLAFLYDYPRIERSSASPTKFVARAEPPEALDKSRHQPDAISLPAVGGRFRSPCLLLPADRLNQNLRAISQSPCTRFAPRAISSRASSRWR